MTMVSGIGIATGWQELGGTPAPPANLLRLGYDSPYNYGYTDWTGWTWNGLDMVTQIKSVMQSYLGDCAVYDSVTSAPFVTLNNLFFYYQNTSDISIDVLDPLGNPVSFFTFQTCTSIGGPCDAGYCYTASFDTTDKICNIKMLNYLGLPYFDSFNSDPYNAYVDVVDQASLDVLFKLLYGPSANVTSVYDPFNNKQIITVSDIYHYNPLGYPQTILVQDMFGSNTAFTPC